MNELEKKRKVANGELVVLLSVILVSAGWLYAILHWWQIIPNYAHITTVIVSLMLVVSLLLRGKWTLEARQAYAAAKKEYEKRLPPRAQTRKR